MTLQTILFDLDGTLLDSAPGLMTSTNTALARCGCPPRSLAQITAAMGNGMADLIARSLPGGAEDPRFAACFDAFQEAYQSDMFTGSAPYPGILELLEALGNRGCRLAVVSNKRDGAVKALCRQFFGERIAVAIGERPGVSRKPAPDSALTALQELGMPAQTAAYVGDSEVDNEIQQIMSRNKMTPEEFQRQLQIQRTTEKDFRERIRSSILRNRLLANMVGRKVIVTKEEIADYYNRHKQTFMNNQKVRFAVIVYPPTENAETQAARIRSGKLSFEQAARQVSVGPRAQEGGDVGVVDWNSLDPTWQDRLSQLKPGDVSGLFEVNNGLKGQLKLLSMESGDGQTLEEATPQIERILREPKLQERFREYSEQLRKRAVVEIRQ